MKKTKLLSAIEKYWVVILTTLTAVVVIFFGFGILNEKGIVGDHQKDMEEQDIIYLAMEEIDTLNPFVTKSEDVYNIVGLLYSGLFRYDDDLCPVPELVSLYSCDSEKGEILITLRPGVMFSDGSELKPEDVVFSFKTASAAGTAGQYYDHVRRIKSITAEEDGSISVKFKKPEDCSLNDLIFPIVPSGQYSSSSKFLKAKDSKFVPVGSGLYRFESYDKSGRLVLVPNEFYLGKAASKRLEFSTIPNISQAINLMQIFDVTCCVEKTEGVRSKAESLGLRVNDLVIPEAEFLVLNPESQLLSTPELRAAFLKGINSADILENCYMGEGIQNCNLYFPSYLGSEYKADSFPFDKNSLKETYTAYGYSDRNADGFLQDENGTRASVNVLVNSENYVRIYAARNIKESLEKIGIAVSITALPEDELSEAEEKGEYDVLILGCRFSPDFDLRFLYDGSAPWKYKNEEVLTAVSQLNRVRSEAEVRLYYLKAAEAIEKDAVYYPLCFKRISQICLENFEQKGLPTFADIYSNITTWKWYVEKNS